ncbi:PH domain-containing protein [Agrococcus sp. Ld7]|uniref:PH domain-containing protein n=1 Tax=Agrococcus sp. Ld7 TaxID=649148 RepID=UPI0038636E36
MNNDLRTVTVHSRVNRGMAIAAWALLAVVGALLALGSTVQGMAAVALGVAWLAYAVHVFLWAPSLTVDDRGNEIGNPLRTVTVAWEALIHVDTQYALTLHTPGAKWSVWCAPQASALVARTKARRAREDRDARDPRNPLDAGVRVGDLRGTESGDAAALVRQRWDERRHGDVDAGGVAVPTRIHWGRVTALIVGPVLASVAPLLL